MRALVLFVVVLALLPCFRGHTRQRTTTAAQWTPSPLQKDIAHWKHQQALADAREKLDRALSGRVPTAPPEGADVREQRANIRALWEQHRAQSLGLLYKYGGQEGGSPLHFRGAMSLPRWG